VLQLFALEKAEEEADRLVGALIMETLKKGLIMMSIAQDYQYVVTGIAILLAVAVDNIRRARENAA